VEFRELLPRRRMVRHYRPAAVQLEVVQRIMETIRRAPSAGYSQGQRLLVLTEAEGRSELARIMRESGWTDPDGREPWLETAPVHVLVCTREDDYHDRYRKPDKLDAGREIDWPVPFWFVDAGAAVMLLLLAAIDEGLAAGLSGVEGEAASKVRSRFGIPGDVTIVALVTIGHAAPDPGWSAVTSRRTEPRRPQDEAVRWERWERARFAQDRKPLAPIPDCAKIPEGGRFAAAALVSEPSRLLTDLEAGETLWILVGNVDPIDARAARTFAAERDEPLVRLLLPLEYRLDCPVAVVADPAGHARRLRAPPHALAEEDSLHEAVYENAAAGAGHTR
jgi:FMN reductase [NAD(P)H]